MVSMAEPTLADLGNNLTPLVQPGANVEFVGLGDKSGSHTWPMIKGGEGTRWDFVGGVVYRVVQDIGSIDFMGSKEAGGGGLKYTTFADKPDPKADPRRLNLPKVEGDMGAENFWDVWGAIPVGGHTWAVPGLDLLLADQKKEFGSKPRAEQPDVLGIVGFNDGLLDDLEAFIARLGDLDPSDAGLAPDAVIKMVMSVYGYDNKPAVAKYRGIEERHPNTFRCLELAPSSRPREVSNAMLSILGRPVLAA
jgi:hypothetical protein